MVKILLLTILILRYPLFLDSLDNILENSKNNWLLIKVIKIFDYLIQFEPRLIQKYSKLYSEMLKITKAKSIQYELILTIIKNFSKNQKLYDDAREELASFINNSDPNLRNLGISCLNKMLLNNPQIITQLLNKYLTYLLESYQKSDNSTKIQILEIFQNFTSADNFKLIIVALINSVVNKQQSSIKEKIISVILKICSHDSFTNIGRNNFEWLLKNVLKPIMQDIKSLENANLFSKILNVNQLINYSNFFKDLAIQVENFEQQIYDFSLNALQSLNFQTQATSDADKITIFNNKIVNNSINTYTEILFTTFIYLIGENSSQSKNAEQFLQLLSLYTENWIFQESNNSFHCFQMAEFKIIINFFYFLLKDCTISSNDLLDYLTKAFLFYITSAKSQTQFCSYFIDNIYSEILFKIFNLNMEQLMKIADEKELEQVLQSSIKDFQLEKTFEQINEIKDLFFQKKKQIHPNAQSFVKPPNGLDLTKDIAIDPQELVVIQSLMKQLHQTSAEETISQPKKEVVSEAKIKEENKDQILNQPQSIEEEKEYISYKVNQQLELPLGVTLVDIQKQSDPKVHYYNPKKQKQQKETEIQKEEEKLNDSAYQSL